MSIFYEYMIDRIRQLKPEVFIIKNMIEFSGRPLRRMESMFCQMHHAVSLTGLNGRYSLCIYN